MEWKGFLESYKRIEEFRDKRDMIWEDLQRKNGELREMLNEITQIKEATKCVKYFRTGVVDSSFDELFGDNWGRRLYVVCVAGIGFIPRDGKVEKEEIEPEFLIDEQISSYEEEEDYSRVLKGLAIAKEILSAKEWFKNMDLVVMDGSAKSIVISINQGMTVKGLENSVMGRELKALYGRTLDALLDLLMLGKLLFIPKRSSEVLIADKIADKMSLPIKNDYALLEILLKEGEYVVVETPRRDYNLPKEGVEEEKLQQLFNILNDLKVIYFKSLSGRIQKLETLLTTHVNAIWDFFILEGENILTYLADRSAKFYLSELRNYADKINPWRYRI